VSSKKVSKGKLDPVEQGMFGREADCPAQAPCGVESMIFMAYRSRSIRERLLERFK